MSYKSDVEKVLNYVSLNSGLAKFNLYGGAVCDLFLGKPFADIDVAVLNKEGNDISDLEGVLISNNFKIVDSNRKYELQKGLVEVNLVYAENDDHFLDICFLDTFKDIGLFNLESAQWTYPELKFIDNFNFRDSLQSKYLTPIRDLESENSLLWLSRFIRLCSKYEFSLTNNYQHKLIVDYINSDLINNSYDPNSSQYGSLISSLFKSILCSNDRETLINEFIELDFLNLIAPEIQTFFLNNGPDCLEHCTSERELISVITTSLAISDRNDFIKRVKPLNSKNSEVIYEI